MFQFIQGGVSKDHRGQIRFVNEFDMKDVKRFYILGNESLDVVRGWRAHKIEQRWFYVLHGSFKLGLIKIDNWDKPSNELHVDIVTLNSNENQLIHIPNGYGTAIKALQEDSQILVFADHYLDHAKYDDFTFDVDYFLNWDCQ